MGGPSHFYPGLGQASCLRETRWRFTLGDHVSLVNTTNGLVPLPVTSQDKSGVAPILKWHYEVQRSLTIEIYFRRSGLLIDHPFFGRVNRLVSPPLVWTERTNLKCIRKLEQTRYIYIIGRWARRKNTCKSIIPYYKLSRRWICHSSPDVGAYTNPGESKSDNIHSTC